MSTDFEHATLMVGDDGTLIAFSSKDSAPIYDVSSSGGSAALVTLGLIAA